MNSKIEWQVDDQGSLIKPVVHDGTIFEFSLLSDFKILRFSVRPEAGGIIPQEARISHLEFSRISQINVVELWNCPILSGISIWRVNAVPERCWDGPNSGWRLLFQNQISAVDKAKEQAARTIRSQPSSYLVEVGSSYGGSIALVCESIDVYQES